MYEIIGDDTLERFDAFEANTLLYKVHMGLVVPASHNYELTLLALCVLWPCQLDVEDRRHRLEALLNCDVRLVLVFLVFCPNFKNEAVSFPRAVEYKAIVEVYNTAAHGQL